LGARASSDCIFNGDENVVRVLPFRGLRPEPGMAAQVASPPYDVISTEEARLRAMNNPVSFLRVIKPEIDFAPGTNPYQQSVYERGRENLLSMMNQGILLQDEKPCYYLYRQIVGSHEQMGLVAVTAVDDYIEGRVKKHEHTRPEKVRDRANLIQILGAQTGPVFLTFKENRPLLQLFERALRQQPVYDFRDENGVQNKLYIIDDEELIADIQSSFANIDSLYIADGHHRSEAAAMVYQTLREKEKLTAEDKGYNYFLAVVFPHSHLKILPYNRIIRDLNEMNPTELIRRLEGVCTIKKVKKRFEPAEQHHFGMYLDHNWYSLQFPAPASKDPVENLDVSILHHFVLEPILNIGDPRQDPRIDFVGGMNSLSKIEQMVDSGDYAVGFSLYPTQIEQVLDIADAGRVMPPKSTWFEPKLRSGLFTHLID